MSVAGGGDGAPHPAARAPQQLFLQLRRMGPPPSPRLRGEG
ncbi:hypothetical protein EKH55_3598 [Sinorhizobium alkalisoli]|nr:hypothetical protein EKH55_3598 [Sinorhizobium alkalisoli]